MVQEEPVATLLCWDGPQTTEKQNLQSSTMTEETPTTMVQHLCWGVFYGWRHTTSQERTVVSRCPDVQGGATSGLTTLLSHDSMENSQEHACRSSTDVPPSSRKR